MESPQNIKKRQKSVANINKITKAMEMVAATKMRRAQEIALASRPYSFMALELLATLSVFEKPLKKEMSALFETRKPIKKVLFILVSSDKGLAGVFNSAVFKKFESHLLKEKEEWKKEEHLYVAIGEKAYAYLIKKGFRVIKKFTRVGDYTTPEQIKPIVDFIVNGYKNKDWDRVIVISTHFKSALKQEPHVRRILPISFDHVTDTVREILPERGKFAELIKENEISFIPDKSKIKEYLIEPSPQKVLSKLAEHLFFIQFYHLILETNASEHSARRMAMKTASDNASELGEKLSLQYNKSRQALITKEISEITAGVEALQ